MNKLDAWADDLKEGLEASIKELDKQIKEVRREAKIVVTLEEKLALQKQQKNLESQRNKSRRELFDKQDEVDGRREELIESLEGKLNKNNGRNPVYCAMECEVIKETLISLFLSGPFMDSGKHPGGLQHSRRPAYA